MFARAADAVAAALGAQIQLTTEVWPAGLDVRVRMGLHTGEAVVGPDGHAGADVHIASRVCGLAAGGQVLISETTAALVRGRLPDGATFLDVGEHELRDVGVATLSQLSHPDLPTHLATHGRRPGDLPLLRSSFVGREVELADLRELLEQCALVTLVGTGGVGKTRLAIRLAHEVKSEFKQGAWFVDLTTAHDEQTVAVAVLATLAIPESPLMAPVDAIASHLRLSQALLVLDNCEGAVDACARMCDRLLAQCADLRVVATSRASLGSALEQLVAVEPLGLAATSEDAADAEAIRLFVDRARHVRRPFTLDDTNISAVSELCRLVDGLPLAIELAAARARVLSPEQMVAELRTDVDLLASSAPGRPDRHRSLQACVEWSHRLLTEPQRILLARLSSFSGGFTLAAARAVCCDDLIRETRLLDELDALVDASLVVAPTSGRFRLYETIRHFAASELGDDLPTRQRHLAWVGALTTRVGADYSCGAPVIEELTAELDNVTAAVEFALLNDPEAGMRVLGPLWFIQGELPWTAAVGQLASRLLEALPEADLSIRGNVALAVAYSALSTIDFATATQVANELVKLGEDSGDELLIGRAANVLGWVGLQLHTPGSDEPLRRAVRIGRNVGDRSLTCDALEGLGMIEALTGQAPAGIEHLEEAVAIAEEERWEGVMLPSGLAFLGCAHLVGGSPRRALAALDRALTLLDALPAGYHWFHTPFVSGMRVVNLTMMGRFDEARVALARCLSGLDRHGHPTTRAVVEAGAGILEHWQGNDDAAVEYYMRSLAFGVDPFWASWCRVGLAYIMVDRRDFAGAHAQVTALSRTVDATDDVFHRLRADLVLAEIARIEGDLPEATTRASAALANAVELNVTIVAIDALHALARFAALRGDDDRAARLVGAVDALREQTSFGQPLGSARRAERDLAGARERLGEDRFEELRAEGASAELAEAVGLALAGRGPRKRPIAGWDSLTPAERNVVRLVADGLSNAEIGERLFISRRTVDRHMSNILTKTGFTSRAQVAAEEARRSPH